MSSALTSPTETMPRPSPPPAGDRSEVRSPQPDGGSASRLERAQARQIQNQSPSRSQSVGASAQAGSARDAGPSGGNERDAVKDAMADLRRQLGTTLDFEIDEELDRPIVRVRNPETEEVIRQIPPEEMLAVARQLREEHNAEPQGVLLDVQR
ncbi:flagellar protein FlaG [Thiohalorhabdus sp.]|uniref:flagellar protein FlaG n=1 Tax=Thiohalorhabdus sp. TaxID=3094134 RepID=UPI002FC2D63B